MNVHPLQRTIEHYFTHPEATTDFTVQAKALEAFFALRTALEAGELRAAEPDELSRPAGASMPGSNRGFSLASG